MKKRIKGYQSSANNMKAKEAKLIANNLFLKIKNNEQGKNRQFK